MSKTTYEEYLKRYVSLTYKNTRTSMQAQTEFQYIRTLKVYLYLRKSGKESYQKA